MNARLINKIILLIYNKYVSKQANKPSYVYCSSNKYVFDRLFLFGNDNKKSRFKNIAILHKPFLFAYSKSTAYHSHIYRLPARSTQNTEWCILGVNRKRGRYSADRNFMNVPPVSWFCNMRRHLFVRKFFTDLRTLEEVCVCEGCNFWEYLSIFSLKYG